MTAEVYSGNFVQVVSLSLRETQLFGAQFERLCLAILGRACQVHGMELTWLREGRDVSYAVGHMISHPPFVCLMYFLNRKGVSPAVR